MTDLPDINVWLALADENHVHHKRARTYWQNDAPPTVAFCRISMIGFLRLATQSRVLSAPLSVEEAWDIYRRYRSSEGIVFLPEVETGERAFESLTRSSNFTPRLWTDAYLAAFAISSGCRVVSFDSDFGKFDGLSFLHLVA
jgi:toxin-antitoxin system PIN domain toxin